MIFNSAFEALSSQSFFIQAVISFILNGLLNGFIAWSTFSGMGKLSDAASFPAITIWSWNAELNTCGVMDVLLTASLMAFFTVLLGSPGIKANVRKNKCEVRDKTKWQ